MLKIFSTIFVSSQSNTIDVFFSQIISTIESNIKLRLSFCFISCNHLRISSFLHKA
ncbi:hypothetical protein HOG21_01790 [bacterium]|nr:hypothetical protein [bacterium]